MSAFALQSEPATDVDPVAGEVLLRAEGVERSFVHQRARLWRKAARFNAVEGVSLALHRGETLAVVGESGCGKSTLGRLVAGLTRPSVGRVVFDGQDLNALDDAGFRAMRRRVQVVFQDAPGSLDPRVPVEDQVREPLDLHAIGSRHERGERAAAMLDAVKLGPHLRRAVPSELSGGQQQRVVIARALILEPELLICDEPVSALDVSIQAQVLALLVEMRARFGLTLVFISHDLSVVRQIAERVAVMYLGEIVEEGVVADVFDRPRHPYTRALVSAVPVPDPSVRRERVVLAGDPPSPQAPPAGCRFHTRCPKAEARCAREAPRWRATNGRGAACHFPEAVR